MDTEQEKRKKDFEKFFKDEEKVKEILVARTKEDVKKIFLKSNLEITDLEYEELKNICSTIVTKIAKLNDDELNDINGGIGCTAGCAIGGAVLGGIAGVVLSLVPASVAFGSENIGLNLGGAGMILGGTALGAAIGAVPGAIVGAIVSLIKK